MLEIMVDMENEIWKSISGYEGMYEVSDLGNLRSLERQVNHPRKVSCTRKPRPCQLVTIKGGYYQVRLHKNGVERRFLIHRLVMYSFRGVKLLHVDHINGIRTDNRLLNLRYCTLRENNVWHAEKNRIGKSSKYIGVSLIKETGKWEAKIQINKKTIHLGKFNNEYDAHVSYQEALNKNNDNGRIYEKIIIPN